MTAAVTDAGTPVEARVRRASVDVWSCLSAAVAATFVVAAARPVGDPDIWWHVRTGELILQHGLPHTEPWAFTAKGHVWTPTAWLSDVLFALVHDGLGWRGIILLKLALGTLLVTALFRLLFANSPARLAAPVFILVTITLSPFISERPQLISLCFVVWLAAQVRNMLLDGRISWAVVPITYAWANLHGMWVLAPLGFGLAAVAVAADQRTGWRVTSAKAIAVALGCMAVSALTPAGPRLTVSALVVRRAASDVSEWQPTNLLDHYSVFLLVLVLIWASATARAGTPTPRSEIVWMGVLLVFALTAARNVAPVAILMSPFVLLALERHLGPRLAQAAKAPQVPRLTLWAIGAGAAVIALLLVAARPPLVSGLPTKIVSNLMARPGPVRVLDSYGVGGYLTGAGAPHISVAIDGRTDNYDPAFVHRYFLAMGRMVGWRSLIADLDPDVAVIGRHSQLTSELKRLGWRVTLTDGNFALLEPPLGSP